MLAIKNNLMAVNAARYLGQSYDALAKSVERLSSGLRINSAKDDAAGLAVRELMRADVAVLEQGARNAQDGVSLLQTMEGAMGTIDSCLVRMKQLSEQAATGSYSSAQRVIMNSEFAEMAAEVERIATATKFNDITLLNNTNDVSIQFGGSTDAITVTGADMTKSGLGIETGTGGTEATGKFANAVATADSTFITNTDASTLSITFTDSGAGDDERTIEVDFAAGAHTLNEVAEAINLVSQNLGNDSQGNNLNYTAAEVVTVTDGSTIKYTLKLSSRTSLADGLTMTTDDSDIS
jgi:flagellin